MSDSGSTAAGSAHNWSGLRLCSGARRATRCAKYGAHVWGQRHRCLRRALHFFNMSIFNEFEVMGLTCNWDCRGKSNDESNEDYGGKLHWCFVYWAEVLTSWVQVVDLFTFCRSVLICVQSSTRHLDIEIFPSCQSYHRRSLIFNSTQWEFQAINTHVNSLRY